MERDEDGQRHGLFLEGERESCPWLCFFSTYDKWTRDTWRDMSGHPPHIRIDDMAHFVLSQSHRHSRPTPTPTHDDQCMSQGHAVARHHHIFRDGPFYLSALENRFSEAGKLKRPPQKK